MQSSTQNNNNKNSGFKSDKLEKHKRKTHKIKSNQPLHSTKQKLGEQRIGPAQAKQK